MSQTRLLVPTHISRLPLFRVGSTNNRFTGCFKNSHKSSRTSHMVLPLVFLQHDVRDSPVGARGAGLILAVADFSV